MIYFRAIDSLISVSNANLSSFVPIQAVFGEDTTASDGVSCKFSIPSSSIAAARICPVMTAWKKSSQELKFAFGLEATFVLFIRFLSWYMVACSLADSSL